MNTLYCGLDAGSITCHLAAINQEGDKVESINFPTGEGTLRTAFSVLEARTLKVHLEAGEMARWLRSILLQEVPAVRRVVVSHPKSLSWIARDPLKGDPVDAWKLAELLRLGRTHEVYYSDQSNRIAFRELVNHYEDMTAQQVRLKLKIGARFRREGVFARGPELYSPRKRGDYLAAVDSPLVRKTIEHLYQCLEQALGVQQQTVKLMRREAAKYEEIERFQQVPGIGFILACRFSAYIQNPHRFSNKRKLWRYCGLAVTDRSSGGRPLGYRRLDPNGHKGLKDLSRKAYMGAMQCKGDNAFKRARRRYLDKGGDQTPARLKVQRKIVVTLWTLWKKGTTYQDDKG